jgi:hypothetical protein
MLSTHFRSPGRPSDRDLRLTDLYAHQAANVIVRRIAEQRLGESEARLQAAVDLVGLGCYSWDLLTNALHWDARVKAMWGLPPEAHVDYGVFIAGVHPDDRRRVEAAIAKCADPESTTLSTAFMGSVTASSAGLRPAAKPISKTKRRRTFSVLHWTSVTRKNTKRSCGVSTTLSSCDCAAYLEANQKLRSEIAAHAKAEMRLQELRSELSHAARLSEVGQMAGALAHEVNQPLGATANFVNAARRLLANGDQRRIDAARRNMEDAAAQVLRAGQIIRRVRDFVGQGETDKRLEDVVQMIEEAGALALVGPDGGLKPATTSMQAPH